MLDFTQLDSVHVVLDRARRRIRPTDLTRLVMNDPGGGAYVAAFTRVLEDGASALFVDHEGLPLLRSFDITENLLLSHSHSARSDVHRWFSILCASIELLGWTDYEGLRGAHLSQSFRHLLVDAYALDDAGRRDAPIDLLPAVFREFQQTDNRHHYALALLCELLVPGVGAAEVETRCRQLHELHEEFQVWGDDAGEPNLWFVERTEFLFGALVRGGYESAPRASDLATWAELVQKHFPKKSALAQETAAKLVDAAKGWKRGKKGR